MREYIKVMRNYANFRGRASRKEYWMSQLFFFLIYLAALFLDLALGTTFGESDSIFQGVFSSLAFLVHLVPLIAVTVRRLHDIDKSGWYFLISLIPLGPILLFIWMLKPGTRGENRFGPPPT